jgi:general secretion pathway protein A
MYSSFYRLTRSPFEITPDPFFFFETPHHNEALASLCHGVTQHKGFVVITGEVGTGKTLLLRCLMDLLRSQGIAFASIFDPGLSPVEFLRYMALDLGIRCSDPSKANLLFELNNFLIARFRAGSTTALIVDEAQHLALEVLEEIRLLSNLETTQRKLLQIVLAGQPELELKLDSLSLRQLKQRVTFRCRLEPLSAEEVKSYILQRLERAGLSRVRASQLLPERTVEEIYRYSRGIPRLINNLCENGLIAAFSQKSPAVEPKYVAEIANDLRLNVITTAFREEEHVQSAQHDAARLLLQCAEYLERVANPPLGSKIREERTRKYS